MGLDSIEFVLTVEKELGLSLPDDEIERTSTVGQLTDLIWRHIQAGNSTLDAALLPASRADVYEYLFDVLVVDLGVNGTLVNENARFAKDLGLD